MNEPLALLKSIGGAALVSYLRVYHRHEICFDSVTPDRQMLIVANHGFGGVFDLNVVAMFAVARAAAWTRPTTALVHQIAWTLGVGKVVEAFGGRPAGRDAAREAFAAGHNVLVFPGGDLDAGKSWIDRHRVRFNGHDGFAQLAIDHDVPVLPVVTAGAGESVVVFSDGRQLANALRLPDRLRMHALPVSLSIPWGLNVGFGALLPYLPLPTKLTTAVMSVIEPGASEQSADLAVRIESAMQHRLDELVAHRVPLLG